MIPFHSRPPAPSTDAIRISNMCCVLCDMNETTEQRIFFVIWPVCRVLDQSWPLPLAQRQANRNGCYQ